MQRRLGLLTAGSSGFKGREMINQQQYKRLMSEYEKKGNISISAMKADLTRPTARKYIETGKCPAELQAKHTWRTRPDPLEEVWPKAQQMLERAPELEAKELFESLRNMYGEDAGV